MEFTDEDRRMALKGPRMVIDSDWAEWLAMMFGEDWYGIVYVEQGIIPTFKESDFTPGYAGRMKAEHDAFSEDFSGQKLIDGKAMEAGEWT